MKPDTPKWRRYLRFWGPDAGKDVAEELRFHLETEIEDLVARGLSPVEARTRALTQFGDVNQALADCRVFDARRLRRVRWAQLRDVLRQEIRYVLRGFSHRPAFTAAVVATLALGVGANAAVFSIIDRVFLRLPESVPRAAELRRLSAVRHTRTRGDDIRSRFNLPEARAIASRLDAAFPTTIYLKAKDTRIQLEPGATRLVSAGWVTPNFLRTLGVHVAIGRDLAAADLQFGQPAGSAIISWGFAQRELGGAERAVGRTIRVDGHHLTIIGVAPRGFSGIDVDAADVWMPLSGFLTRKPDQHGPWYEQRGMRGWQLVSAVPREASDEQLAVQFREAMRADARDYLASHPGKEQFGDTAAAARIGSIIAARGPMEISHEMSIAKLLAGVAALILVIASANVGNLLLGRALQRRREIAVRLALGMSRLRLIGQVVIESTLLALLAAGAATIAAAWIGGALRTMLFPEIEWAGAPVDARITLFATVLGLLGGIAAGLIPAHELVRVDLGGALKSGTREGGGRRSRIRATLVGVQAALSLLLLVGTGLFARTLQNIRGIDLGYDVEHVITMSARDTAVGARLPEIAALARSLPGVQGVALTGITPLDGRYGAWLGRLFTRDGDTVRALGNRGEYMIVEPSYLSVVGTRVVRGRDLSSYDRVGAAPVMVVSEAMARQVWPGRDALGQCLRVLKRDAPCYTVVGVAENAHGFKVVEDPTTVFYVTLEQSPNRTRSSSGDRAEGMVVRVVGDPSPVIRRLRSEMRDTISGGARSVALMADVLAPQYRPWQLGARLFASFAALALVLAALGLYSVLAYVVTLRRHELGVRLALGASHRRLMRLVIGDGIRQVAVGVGVGTLIVLVGSRFLASLLYNVSPRDPIVIVVAISVLLGSAVMAALLPARRAARVDPMIALRDE